MLLFVQRAVSIGSFYPFNHQSCSAYQLVLWKMFKVNVAQAVQSNSLPPTPHPVFRMYMSLEKSLDQVWAECTTPGEHTPHPPLHTHMQRAHNDLCRPAIVQLAAGLPLPESDCQLAPEPWHDERRSSWLRLLWMGNNESDTFCLVAQQSIFLLPT